MGPNYIVQLIAVRHSHYQMEASSHNDDRGKWMLEEYRDTFANHATGLGQYKT